MTFVKGVSGNPGGGGSTKRRKRGSLPRLSRADERAVFKQLTAKAKRGSLTAMKLLLAYSYGPPKAPPEPPAPAIASSEERKGRLKNMDEEKVRLLRALTQELNGGPTCEIPYQPAPPPADDEEDTAEEIDYDAIPIPDLPDDAEEELEPAPEPAKATSPDIHAGHETDPFYKDVQERMHEEELAEYWRKRGGDGDKLGVAQLTRRSPWREFWKN